LIYIAQISYPWQFSLIQFNPLFTVLSFNWSVNWDHSRYLSSILPLNLLIFNSWVKCYVRFFTWHQLFVCLMVFNATFNNISVILWRSVLLVEEVTDKLYHIMLYTSPWSRFELTTSVISCFLLFNICSALKVNEMLNLRIYTSLYK
jgi:hypothetical protein